MPPAAARERVARRRRLAAAAPLVVLAGLVGRYALPGGLGDAVGGVLYTVVVYLAIAFAAPNRAEPGVAVTAFAISVAVELFQLTSIPADLGDAFAPSKLLLGSTFVATDFIAYAAGALLAAATDRVMPAGRS